MPLRIQSSTTPVSAPAATKTGAPGQFASALASTSAIATPAARTSSYVSTPLTLAQQKAVSAATTTTSSADTSTASSDEKTAMEVIEQQSVVLGSAVSNLGPSCQLDDADD